MSYKKNGSQDFQHQIKDIRGQLYDQVKCLEIRSETQVSILHEINDFFKKRAELDLEYAKQLDKLVKNTMLKHKNEKNRRANWHLYSLCSLWQQLVDDTKDEARQRGITAEIYNSHVTTSISARCALLQKLSKKVNTINKAAAGTCVPIPLHFLFHSGSV
uniref:FCH domain-containing protein n=1 Tax=Acrobeloides nanus TaxID=290746 RepID=A0A914BYH4_9BILA